MSHVNPMPMPPMTRGPSARNPFIKKEDNMAHIEGIAERLDCEGVAARLYITVGSRKMAFEIPDPTYVLIKHRDEEHHDFTCGLQKPYRMAIDYAVKPDAKAGTEGIVRGLEF